MGGDMGTEQNKSGVWLHFQRALILCCASSFPNKTGKAKTRFCENGMEQLLDVLLQHVVNLPHRETPTLLAF